VGGQASSFNFMWEGEDCEAILRLLGANRGHLYSAKEIGRAIDRQRFKEDNYWARNDLRKLLDHGRIDQDNSGYYFIPKDERQI